MVLKLLFFAEGVSEMSRTGPSPTSRHSFRNARGRFSSSAPSYVLTELDIYDQFLDSVCECGDKNDWVPVSQDDGILKDVYETVDRKEETAVSTQNRRMYQAFLRMLIGLG